MATSRWWLYVQAVFWRSLMRIGMFLHDLAPPRPPWPTFTRSIKVDDSDRSVVLHFYCPPDYYQKRRQGHRFPVAVNFHGGGFTLGCATDDGRWCAAVVEQVEAVVVSVSYRRAPEFPFPTAVDDGVEALLYMAAQAVDLALDVSRVALSGFSAGGNLAVTVPLRLRDRVSTEVKEHFGRADSTQRLVDPTSDLNIVALFCWYPILDFLESREHRRAVSIMPDKSLPAFFTTLFDHSYLPDSTDHSSPFASPVRASDRILSEALPRDVFLYICEWDMLMKEGQYFVRRLEGLGKRVRAMMIEKARHAWDKSPNPWRDQNSVNVLYRDACADMKRIFDR
ncbi:Alpha/beta hydrolase fold-3 [Penicillium capsulatum]|uniref:Alpha/beta hydrolase fold-3 n=1 Tax=Penicillium capsulatum TaxID=69766 RepID=A0A9W9IN88_9EURO|nr:Alpha/beta hydrolase fold-3 [Penicillium capsulatum]KAJ6123369.1 Alpha/beta hydrolase fold-3 [Penicillium capsulatum]